MRVASRTRVEIVGHVGGPPEMKKVEDHVLAQVRVAVSPKSGVTEWFRIVFWDELATLVKDQIKKGAAVKIQGHLRARVQEGDEALGKPRREFVDIVGKRVGVFTSEDSVRYLGAKGGDAMPVE